MKEVIVRELWTYPVKGCQAVASESLEIRSSGIVGDRMFALWRDGELLDAKDTPRVASLAIGYDPATPKLTFQHSEAGTHEHAVLAEGEKREAKWILDQFATIDQGDEVAAWLTEAIQEDVRLVTVGEAWKINFPIPQMKLLHGEDKNSFFAASPVSLANTASLAELNRQLDAPVSMNRFRMNVVVEGLEAYEEGALTSLENDQVQLLHVTAAERCVIVETDQITGERAKTGLLKQLPQKTKEERFGSGRIFGTYLQVAKSGTLSVGDRLAVS